MHDAILPQVLTEEEAQQARDLLTEADRRFEAQDGEHQARCRPFFLVSHALSCVMGMRVWFSPHSFCTSLGVR